MQGFIISLFFAVFLCASIGGSVDSKLENNVVVAGKSQPLNLLSLFEVRQRMAQQRRFLKNVAPNGQKDDINKLCQPCIQFFSVLKDLIGDVDTLTRDTLKNALDTTCKYLEGSVPFVDQVCEVFGPKVIDLLYRYITEVASEIEPEHDCKLILLCWGSQAQQANLHELLGVPSGKVN